MHFASQASFDFLVTPVVGPKRELMHVGEAADCLGYERSKIYELSLEGFLEAHRDPEREKSQIRITRRSVVARLAVTAQYDPADLVETVLSITRSFTREQRQQLAAALQKQA